MTDTTAPSKRLWHEMLIYAAYYAPRGRRRLYLLAKELSVRYLHPDDLLIGIIGDEGAGKSTFIRGLFPGLELTNDDEGVNLRSTPLFEFDTDDFFSGHTFHLDARYEAAFRQRHEIATAVRQALEHGRRVVVEHFDLLHETLGFNAQVLFGIGEEVIVVRPTVFGPLPEAIRRVVARTIRFRRMVHSAEDLTMLVLRRDYDFTPAALHSEVKHGFVICFTEEPQIDIAALEHKVNELIRQDLPIEPARGDSIRIGTELVRCTGTRTHVASTGRITDFRLLHEYRQDPLSREYMLIGMVGRSEVSGFEDLAPVVG